MKLKKFLAMVLCVAMVLSTMSFSVFAEDEAATEFTNVADDVITLTSDVTSSEGGEDDTTYVAQIGGQKFKTVLEAFTAAMESTTAVEVKLLQHSTELLETDFEFIVKADVVISADTPVTAAFYNNGTKYDLVLGSVNNNTITVDDNVTLKVTDRNIWLGYYGDKNVTVKVYGTLSAGYQLWSGSDVEVHGTLESLGEALVLRRGKTLTVDGGKVNASYFSILAGNIDAKNGATIECGPVWISNTGSYANEGNVEIVLDNATLTSSSNLKSATTHTDGVSFTINNSTASFLGNEHGASQLDANTKLVVSGDNAQLGIKDITNNGTIIVYDGGKVSAAGSITNNGAIEVENAEGFTGTVSGIQPVEKNYVAKVGDVKYTDIQQAIKKAAPAGTVELLDDVTVDEWIMFSETLNISSEQIITLEINGLTIVGNGHTITINSVESAANGNRLFYDATELNIQDLTIKYAEGVNGGIGLTSGTISNVTFDGGVSAVYPGTGKVTITECIFKTTGHAIYYEVARDNLVVSDNTFNLPATANVILLRGKETFTGNTIVSGRTVNVVSGSPVVTGNDFGDVRFKVYNEATATISNNKINNLVFNNEIPPQSTFTDNTLSKAAEEALKAVAPVASINETMFNSLNGAFTKAVEGDTIVLLADATPDFTSQRAITKASVIDLNGKTLTLTEDDLYFGTTTFKNGNIVVDPLVKPSTAVFWMFENQTLTFDNVDITATGVAGTYLIGINGGTGTAINLLKGTNIIIDNDSIANLTAVICDNGTGNSVTIDNADIDVKNIEGRFYLGGANGTISVNNSDINLNGVKEGFYIRAGQNLSIEGTSTVNVDLNDPNGRYGINVTNATATYNKADTAIVEATDNMPRTLTFETNGGDAIAALSVANGTIVDLSEFIPTRRGYTFRGWFADAGLETLISSITLTADTTIYAKWAKKNASTSTAGSTLAARYTLSFDTDGGNEIESVSMQQNTVVDLSEYSTTKEGYRFDGWYINSELTEAVTTLTLTAHTTVYAKWVEETETQKPSVSARPAILRDDHVAYLLGREDGCVHPEANITRAEAATIFFRLLREDVLNKALTKENAFMDVNDEDWFCTAVSTLTSLEIITGRTIDTFAPYEAITRAELTAIVARLSDATCTGTGLFGDTHGHWAESYINEVAEAEWIVGYNGLFRPDDNITRAEVMTLVNRVLHREPESKADLLDGMTTWKDNANENAWYYLAVQEATNSHTCEMKADGKHEKWTSLTENPDWSKLEG